MCIIYTELATNLQVELLLLTSEYLHMTEGIRHFKGTFLSIKPIHSPKIVSQTHSYTSWFFSFPCCPALMSSSTWLSMIQNKTHFPQRWKARSLLGNNVSSCCISFSSHHVTRTLQKHKTPSCFVLSIIFCSISNQPFVKGAAKAHKGSSCSLAAASVQLREQLLPEALPRGGWWCSPRQRERPKENPSPLQWLSPHGMNN